MDVGLIGLGNMGSGIAKRGGASPTLKNAAPGFTRRADRRDGRVAEGARLESVYTGNRIVGSNPTLSARKLFS